MMMLILRIKLLDFMRQWIYILSKKLSIFYVKKKKTNHFWNNHNIYIEFEMIYVQITKLINIIFTMLMKYIFQKRQ